MGPSLATIMCMYGRCRETRERGRERRRQKPQEEGWMAVKRTRRDV